jgi:hypothetical protein
LCYRSCTVEQEEQEMAQNEFREALQLADALAQFANLEAADAPAFRQKHPNFAPRWWAGDVIDVEHAGATTPVWQREQARIRDLWRTGFAPVPIIQLIASSASLAEYPRDGGTLKLDDMDEATYEAEYRGQRRVYDYQVALMFLYTQPWRAGFCTGCSQPFVRATKTSRYCSQVCFDSNRSRSQLEYWRTKGVKLRAKRSKAKKN